MASDSDRQPPEPPFNPLTEHAHALLELVCEHSLDGLICIDARQRIETFNGAAERIFGRSRTQVIGEAFPALLAAESHGEFGPLLERCAVDEQRGASAQLAARRDDNGPCPIEVGARPFELEGQHYYCLVVRDLSERERLERELHQAQKMEAVGQLASGLAHDFNNILTVIRGYADLLAEILSEQEAARAYVDEIGQAASRAAALTRQVLSFGRRSLLQPRIVALNGIVSETERMLRRLIGADIAFDVRLTPEMDPVRVDPGQIGQVLTNLVVNARDAMPAGGRVTVTTGQAEVTAHTPTAGGDMPPGRYAVLTVQDDGVGMVPEVTRQIFEPFFTTKEPGKGTGLGLSVVANVVHRSGGYVTVQSAPGRGATFRVYLPIVQAPVPAEAAQAAETVVGGKGEAILVVDDDAAVRHVVTEILAKRGYQVHAFDGPVRALAALPALGRVDLVITDVVMPGTGGYALAQHLRERHPELRILFMSGYAPETAARHGLSAEKMVILPKPFSAETLLGTVRSLLDHPEDAGPAPAGR